MKSRQARSIARIRAKRRKAGGCNQCGDPALVRMLVTQSGKVVDRKLTTTCERHRR